MQALYTIAGFTCKRFTPLRALHASALHLRALDILESLSALPARRRRKSLIKNLKRYARKEPAVPSTRIPKSSEARSHTLLRQGVWWGFYVAAEWPITFTPPRKLAPRPRQPRTRMMTRRIQRRLRRNLEISLPVGYPN